MLLAAPLSSGRAVAAGELAVRVVGLVLLVGGGEAEEDVAGDPSSEALPFPLSVSGLLLLLLLLPPRPVLTSTRTHDVSHRACEDFVRCV